MTDSNNNGGAPPKMFRVPRQLTMAGEAQRRARKATVGEVEDGLRNLMRLVKQQLAARDELIRTQDAVIETLAGAIEELEAAVRELNPGWAGLSGGAVPEATPGDLPPQHPLPPQAILDGTFTAHQDGVRINVLDLPTPTEDPQP